MISYAFRCHVWFDNNGKLDQDIHIELKLRNKVFKVGVKNPHGQVQWKPRIQLTKNYAGKWLLACE